MLKPAHAGSFRQDFMASLVVFVIAVPLSLGIALASGMPPMAALVSAIVGGLLTGALSGAPLVVSGPAAGLSAMVLGFVHQFGIEAVYKIAIIAGTLQLIFGALRLGRFIGLIPKAILEGVLSAIGLTILLGQLHILMGQSIPGGAIKNLFALPQSFTKALQGMPEIHAFIAPAFAAGLVALGVQLLWPRLAKRVAWLPSALPATLIGTLFALPWVMPRVQLAALVPHVASALNQLTLADVLSTWPQLLVPAFGLALVASAESLLTARAIDVLAQKRHAHLHTDMEKELLAQGLGNMVAGFLGGMPLTGVMVRSAANFNAGASSRRSTMLHGLFIGLAIMAFPFVLETIPLAVLASILVLTGWKLLNLKALAVALKQHPREVYLWPLTTFAILSTDLLRGFGTGIAVWLTIAGFQRLRLKQQKKKAQTQASEELAA